MLKSEINNLKISLNFLHVSELKGICNKLQLSEKGKKLELIFRIIRFLETGEKLINLPFPKISCASSKQIYELAVDALMLKGAYKNNLKTKLFFKKLIGEHFHFTAFGVDWLNERWMDSNPPTYKEFAIMWQKEMIRRKTSLAEPKAEWAYINFLQDFYKEHPESPREKATEAWEQTRTKHKNYIDKILEKHHE